MKVEDLKNELTSKIKNLILEVLKDFDMSNYEISVYFYDDGICNIYIAKNDYIAVLIVKEKLDICIFEKVFYPLRIKVCDLYTSSNKYSVYDVKNFFDFVDSEPIQIIKTLNDNKELLEKELKNILE